MVFSKTFVWEIWVIIWKDMSSTYQFYMTLITFEVNLDSIGVQIEQYYIFTFPKYVRRIFLSIKNIAFVLEINKQEICFLIISNLTNHSFKNGPKCLDFRFWGFLHRRITILYFTSYKSSPNLLLNQFGSLEKIKASEFRTIFWCELTIDI